MKGGSKVFCENQVLDFWIVASLGPTKTKLPFKTFPTKALTPILCLY